MQPLTPRAVFQVLKQGDVVGAGYEYRDTVEIVEFFFTVNGERLPPIPDREGVFSAGNVARYSNEIRRHDAQHQNTSSAPPARQWHHSPAHAVGDDLIDDHLLAAAPYVHRVLRWLCVSSLHRCR